MDDEGKEGANAVPVECAQRHKHERALFDWFDLLRRLGQLGGVPFVPLTAENSSEVCDHPGAMT